MHRNFGQLLSPQLLSPKQQQWPEQDLMMTQAKTVTSTGLSEYVRFELIYLRRPTDSDLQNVGV